MTAERREYKGGAALAHLSGGISAGATSLTLDTSAGWPSGSVGPFLITIDPGLASEEKIKCSGRSGVTVTVFSGGRGADGTVAVTHLSGAVVKHVMGAIDLDLVNDHAATTSRDDHTQYLHISTARTVSAANTWSALQAFSTATFSGAVTFVNAATKFGAGATGGTGPFIEVGDEGDPANAFVLAKGSPTNVGLILRSKGNLGVLIQTPSGSPIALFDPGTQTLSVGGQVAMSGTQRGVLGLSDIPSALAGFPGSGGWLYSDAGALFWHGGGGTVTPLAVA